MVLSRLQLTSVERQGSRAPAPAARAGERRSYSVSEKITRWRPPTSSSIHVPLSVGSGVWEWDWVVGAQTTVACVVNTKLRERVTGMTSAMPLGSPEG